MSRIWHRSTNSRSHALRFSLAGALLALGAPLGLLALRHLSGRTGRQRRWWRVELRAQAQTYQYLAGATAAAFALFGYALGRREDALVRAHRQVGRLRDELSAVVAHDLRGPIHALRLQAELLLEKAEAGEVRAPVEAIERMRRATTDLTRMVEDLLDAGRLEAGQLRVDPRPLALADAVGELVERLRPMLQAHPLEVEATPAPPALVDPSRFNQILTNLIDNASKYSPAGTPIRVRIEPADGGVLVSVVDRGMGITPADLPRLFDRFFQTQRARAKKSGLGLGLYITKGLVDAHGGRITVESELGRGTTFRVWLPISGGSRA